MPVHKRIKREAADKRHGMTLDELAAFVQEAMREEVPGDTVVRMEATWRSSVKHLEIDQEAEEKRRAKATRDA